MQKLIIIGKKAVAILPSGTLERDNLTEGEIEQLKNAESEEDIIGILDPKSKEIVEENKEAKSMVDDIINKSSILTFENDSAYWREVSDLTLPKEFVKSILDAEKEHDEVRIQTYKNFWTLMSLNPDDKCRKNLFWFLNRNGLVISKCGFFVAYRNVLDTGEKDEEGNTIYTDQHTRTFKIKIGEVVTMPREKCDSSQDVTCSRGLHLGARTWLHKGYYGNTGLVCLCNPADVVAVPHEDHYGKLRTCAYLPIDFAEFDSKGDVIPFKAKDGFDCGYVSQVIYEGLMGTEQDSPYKIIIPEVAGINKQSISDALLDIALKCITDRQI